MLLLGCLLVVVAAAGVGAYLAIHRPPASVQVSGRSSAGAATAAPEASAATPPAAPAVAPTPTQAATPDDGAADRTAVLSAIDGHWGAIGSRDFESAYGYLAPDLATGQAAWVSSHQQDGIVDVRYDFAVDQVTGDTATVDVLTLQTVAEGDRTSANPSGCLSWTGTYTLTRMSGRWLISQAAIRPTPC